jgi:hypothetical protein
VVEFGWKKMSRENAKKKLQGKAFFLRRLHNPRAKTFYGH